MTRIRYLEGKCFISIWTLGRIQALWFCLSFLVSRWLKRDKIPWRFNRTCPFPFCPAVSPVRKFSRSHQKPGYRLGSVLCEYSGPFWGTFSKIRLKIYPMMSAMQWRYERETCMISLVLSVFAAVLSVKKCFWRLLSTAKFFLNRTVKQFGPAASNI